MPGTKATARTTKSAPAKTADAPAATRTRVDPSVFAGLTVRAETAPLPKIQRESSKTPNPFLDQMRESRENDGAPFGFEIEEAAVARAKYLLRQAGEEIGCGVRIVTDEPENGRVLVRFAAKDKRKVKPRAATA